jgi:hypothetical protein
MTISRLFSACLLGLTLSGALGALPVAAEDYWSLSCGDLWYQRNAIFARNGYCFKTDRALRVFGNENCRYWAEGDVPMSRAERQEVEYIREVERRKGCQF